jgi:hypothetical protein
VLCCAPTQCDFNTRAQAHTHEGCQSPAVPHIDPPLAAVRRQHSSYRGQRTALHSPSAPSHALWRLPSISQHIRQQQPAAPPRVLDCWQSTLAAGPAWNCRLEVELNRYSTRYAAAATDNVHSPGTQVPWQLATRSQHSSLQHNPRSLQHTTTGPGLWRLHRYAATLAPLNTATRKHHHDDKSHADGACRAMN